MDFWELHDQYYSRVKQFILGLVKDTWVAEDLVQETFIRIQQNVENLRDQSKVSSWIFRIAFNLCQDHFRKPKESPIDEAAIYEKGDDLDEFGTQKEIER